MLMIHDHILAVLKAAFQNYFRQRASKGKPNRRESSIYNIGDRDYVSIKRKEDTRDCDRYGYARLPTISIKSFFRLFMYDVDVLLYICQ